jgi:nicotinamidase-related amidase
VRTLQPADALVVIDVQRKYAVAGAPLEVDGAAGLVGRIAAFAERVRAAGGQVVWVTREGRPGVSMGARTARLFGSAAQDLYRTDWADLDERLGARDDEARVVKLRQSSFYATDLDVVLRGAGITRVLLAGVTTNVCVLATAQDAAARDYEVVVVSDLTASLPIRAEGHEMTAEAVQAAALAFVRYAAGDVVAASDLP